MAGEATKFVVIHIGAARGGHGRAIDDLASYRRLIEKGVVATSDVFVIAIDANCKGLNEARKDIEKAITGPLEQKTVIACPDPHIERWLLADPASFHEVVGSQPTLGKQKCGRDVYKELLVKAIRDAGQTPTLSGVKFAQELAKLRLRPTSREAVVESRR